MNELEFHDISIKVPMYSPSEVSNFRLQGGSHTPKKNKKMVYDSYLNYLDLTRSIQKKIRDEELSYSSYFIEDYFNRLQDPSNANIPQNH